jgi:hypothetical protein
MARSDVSQTCLEGPGYQNYKHNDKTHNSSLLIAIPSVLPLDKDLDDELL